MTPAELRDTVGTEGANLPALPMEVARLHPAPLAVLGAGPFAVEPRHAAPPEVPSPHSFASLTRAFRHRWLLALAAGLLLAGICGGLTWHFVPAKYTAYALLRVAEAEPDPILPDGRAGRPAQTERYFENTQVALITSRPILLAALRRPGIAELGIVREHSDPAEWFEKKLKVAFLEKTDILKVSLDGTNAKELAALVNAVKDAYMEEGVNAQRRKKLKTLEDLEKVCMGSEEKLRRQREALHDFAKSLSTSDVQAMNLKQKAVLDEYASLRKELALVQAQVRAAEVGLAIRKDAPTADATVPDYLVTPAVEADTVVLQKKIELAQYDAKISQLSTMYASGHATLVRYEKERKAVRDALASLRTSLRTTLKRQITEKIQGEVEAKGQQAKDNVKVWQRQEALLRAEVDRVGKEAQALGVSSVELELKRGEIEQAESVSKRLREEKERLQVELQSNKQRVDVLHEAEVPGRKNVMAQARIVGLAGFAGLFLGIFGICYREARARRINTEEQVVSELGCRVMGVLPWVDRYSEPGREGGRAPTTANPLALLSESVDSIRALLLCGEEHPNGRLLMVTSAVAREGKTTLASHLAVSVAAAGRKTLLIDCDFRRPELHNVFEVPRGPGLSEVLRGEAVLADAIKPGPVAGLWVLPAGTESHTVDQARVMAEMRKLLDDLRQQYDFVLVDSSPVLPVADALFIGKRVDGVLLSIRPRVSQVPLVCAAVERLTALRIPVLGTVVNGVRARATSYEAQYLVESNG